MIKQVGGRLESVKWLETNKGDWDIPNYRSRLVAMQYNDSKDDTLYASTPPLGALRMIARSHHWSAKPQDRREITVNNVRRAHSYAKQQRHVFIDLPQEDDKAKEGEVGHLLLCLYGTRDAAREWQKTLSMHLPDIGFVPGRGHPAVFHHPERDMRV